MQVAHLPAEKRMAATPHKNRFGAGGMSLSVMVSRHAPPVCDSLRAFSTGSPVAPPNALMGHGLARAPALLGIPNDLHAARQFRASSRRAPAVRSFRPWFPRPVLNRRLLYALTHQSDCYNNVGWVHQRDEK